MIVIKFHIGKHKRSIKIKSVTNTKNFILLVNKNLVLGFVDGGEFGSSLEKLFFLIIKSNLFNDPPYQFLRITTNVAMVGITTEIMIQNMPINIAKHPIA